MAHTGDIWRNGRLTVDNPWAASAAAAMASASAADSASGFSQITRLPVSSAAMAMALCSAGGTPM